MIQFVSPGVPRDAFLWLAGRRETDSKRDSEKRKSDTERGETGWS